jgi:subtilisin family serine protease
VRKLAVAAFAVVLVSAFVTPLASAGPRKASIRLAHPSLDGYSARYVPGEAIVKYKAGASRAAAIRSAAAVGARMVAGPIHGFSLVKASASASVHALIDRLEADPTVAYAEPNYLRFVSSIPNDPRFSDQWGLNNIGQAHAISSSNATRLGTADADMDVVEAWDTTTGDAETIVAIMDSGVDVTHPDLAANMWVNPGEIAGNNIDDDGNGYKDDVNGWDFADNDKTLLQSTGEFDGWDHGTHVAGIVGAVANNGIGVAGVCSSCKLMVLKMFEPYDLDGDGVNDSMVGNLAGELEAFQYAADMGADVINGSFGASIYSSRSERAAIKSAVAAGLTMVFAAGNENGDNDLLIPGLDFDGDEFPDMTSPAYPASYDLNGVLAVAASNDRDQNAFQSACFLVLETEDWPCTFTNFGHESVDLSGPGVDVLSTLPDNTYEDFDGTSMASPNVAGVAGLVISEHPEYTPAQVVNAIMNSVDTPASLLSLGAFGEGATLSGVHVTATAGRVNANAALTAPTTDLFPTTDGNIAGARSLSGTMTDSVSWPEDTNDVYKKKLVKGTVYKAILNAVGNQDLDLQIYKPGAKEIWQFDERCFGTSSACQVLYYAPDASGDVTVKFKATKSALYYFHVNSWLLNEDNYSIKVVKV